MLFRSVNSIYDVSTYSAYGDCQDATATHTTTAQCITGGPSTSSDLLDETMSGASFTSTLACGTGKALVGGGCVCPAGETLLEILPTDDQAMQCTCTNSGGSGTIRTRVLCAD